METTGLFSPGCTLLRRGFRRSLHRRNEDTTAVPPKLVGGILRRLRDLGGHWRCQRPSHLSLGSHTRPGYVSSTPTGCPKSAMIYDTRANESARCGARDRSPRAGLRTGLAVQPISVVSPQAVSKSDRRLRQISGGGECTAYLVTTSKAGLPLYPTSLGNPAEST